MHITGQQILHCNLFNIGFILSLNDIPITCRSAARSDLRAIL